MDRIRLTARSFANGDEKLLISEESNLCESPEN